MSLPQIILNKISYHLPNTSIHFDRVELTFETKKYGIVGDNGVGKTTFLKLLCGELIPDSGRMQQQGSVYCLPQTHHHIRSGVSISDVLGVAYFLQALQRTQQGEGSDKDLALLDQHWDIEDRLQKVLQDLQLWPLDINTPFQNLSGGQRTKILIAKAMLFDYDFKLLDEPTNNLDRDTRQTLLSYIRQSNKGFIIISHDRELLNEMDCILELSSKGFAIYGGNYDHYMQQKKLEREAAEHAFEDAKKSLKQTRQHTQADREKHERAQTKGRKLRKYSSQAKVILDSMKSRSEKTQSRLSKKDQNRLDSAEAKLSEAKENLESMPKYDFTLPKTNVPNGKTVVTIEQLCFYYDDQTPLINNFNLTLSGPERIGIAGPNGCGKSTLLKIIMGDLTPSSGAVQIGVNAVAYLDQQVSFLNPDLSLIDNFISLNPGTSTFDAYSALARFDFRNVAAEKLVKHLSGGERIRAGLAISLLAKTPPQLIILDEPTNHLDLRSIQAIEAMLAIYEGAIVAVSHDQHFLENIGAKKIINLSAQ